MKKKELLKALAGLPDDAEIVVGYVCQGNTVIEAVVAADEDEGEAQLTAASLAAFVEQGWQDNLEQNAKVRARAEGLVSDGEWRAAQQRARRRRR